ncbi:hypothetical protein [Dysgonomonas massiliensis]|nr:hypothetical protein [Dysgonomonas massiliensis]
MKTITLPQYPTIGMYLEALKSDLTKLGISKSEIERVYSKMKRQK